MSGSLEHDITLSHSIVNAFLGRNLRQIGEKLEESGNPIDSRKLWWGIEDDIRGMCTELIGADRECTEITVDQYNTLCSRIRERLFGVEQFSSHPNSINRLLTNTHNRMRLRNRAYVLEILKQQSDCTDGFLRELVGGKLRVSTYEISNWQQAIFNVNNKKVRGGDFLLFPIRSMAR